MEPNEYAALDATDISALVRAGEVSADEVRDAAAAKHQETHGDINAVVEWFDDPTPVSADGLAGPLAGVPFLSKDYGSAEAGRLVEMGSRLAQGMRASETAEFVRRLQTGGVQVVGRSAVPEFIMHGTTESVVHGLTRNPHNLAYSAGGSSGGAGAAVAAGVVPLAHASDCAGSIRIPAAACGLYGLKPSRRRVPWEEGGWGGIAEEFVLTRSVRDAELCLSVLGEGPMVSAAGPLRIAVCTSQWTSHPEDPEVVAAVEAAARVWEAKGHHVTTVGAPVDYAMVMSTWHALFSRWILRDAERASAATGRPIDLDHVEPMGMRSIEAARRLTVADITAAQDTQGLITTQLRQFMRPFDVLVTPTLGRAVIPLGEVAGDVDSMHQYLDDSDALMPYNYLFNVTGWPALSAPAGRGSAGVPLGVQLAGPMGYEPILLRLADELPPLAD